MLKRAAAAVVLSVLFVGPAGAQTGTEASPVSDAADSEVDIMAWSQMAQGVDFELGRGVMRNDVEAARWYRMAAERGYPPAQNGVARLYELGRGLPRSDVRAYKWYSLAAAAGHVTAALDRVHLAQRMSADRIAEAKRLIRAWQPKTD
ncbi:MAG: sel1 repeat family protein [Proteobacteria bacterium]|nr:sel1 repeat family protein [Pseudomonadota bacterium]